MIQRLRTFFQRFSENQLLLLWFGFVAMPSFVLSVLDPGLGGPLLVIMVVVWGVMRYLH